MGEFFAPILRVFPLKSVMEDSRQSVNKKGVGCLINRNLLGGKKHVMLKYVEMLKLKYIGGGIDINEIAWRKGGGPKIFPT